MGLEVWIQCDVSHNFKELPDLLTHFPDIVVEIAGNDEAPTEAVNPRMANSNHVGGQKSI